jgi:hypothetical protein
MKQNLEKVLLMTTVSLLTILTLSSCDSNNSSANSAKPKAISWDSVKALSEGLQPTILPKADDLRDFGYLESFASIKPELSAQNPEGTSGNSDTLSWNPESCYAAASYAVYNANWEISNSEFAKSLGQGWDEILLDRKAGKTLTFSIFSDLGLADMPLLDILERDIKACPITIQKINKVTYNYEFQVSRTSENTIEISTIFSSSEGLVGKSLKIISQVGRNLLASELVRFDWNGNPPMPITTMEQGALTAALQSMATKVEAQQSKNS